MKLSAVKSFEVDVDWAAQTVLPVEFKGKVFELEARAYQGDDPAHQALVLINRVSTATRAATLPPT